MNNAHAYVDEIDVRGRTNSAAEGEREFMSMQTDRRRTGNVGRPPQSGLADVIELILDKGLVIDAYVRVSLVGIEILTIDARIVVASVDTYLRFAEATNRLDLYAHGKSLTDLPEGIMHSGAKRKTAGVLDAAKEKFDEVIHSDDAEEREPQAARRPRRRERSE